MSYQIYFLQSEEDAVQFFDYLDMLNSVIWTGKEFKLPQEVKSNIHFLVSSSVRKYILIPHAVCSSGQPCEKIGVENMDGIEMLLCCKGNPLSRTYEVGRLYCAVNDNNLCHSQLVEFYHTLKSFIVKNYCYNRKSGVYFAPVFKQKFDTNYLFATQLGIPITKHT